MPGALDRGLVYAGCSKVAVVPLPGGAGGYRLLVSLTEPSHSRIWVSQPFRTGYVVSMHAHTQAVVPKRAHRTPDPPLTPSFKTTPNHTYSADLAGMGDAALGAHIVEAPCLVADALLLPSNQPHRGGGSGSPLRLWAALAGGDGDGGGGSGGSLAYVDLPPTASPQPLRLSRLWEPPSDNDGGGGACASASASASAAALLLLPSPREAATTLAARPLPAGAGVGMVGASAGSAFSGSEGGGGGSSSRGGTLRQQLWALHQQLLPSSSGIGSGRGR